MTGRNILSLFRIHWIILLLAFIAIIILGSTHQATKQEQHIVSTKPTKAAEPTPSTTNKQLILSPSPIFKEIMSNVNPTEAPTNIGSPALDVEVTYEIVKRTDPTPTPIPLETRTQSSEQILTEEHMIDNWIAKNNLNQYGDSIDTMYTGGTPLFNEGTGEYTNRYNYIRANHPDAPWNK